VTFPALSNPLNNHRAVPLTEEQFHYAFANTLSEEESRAVTEYKEFAGALPLILGQNGWQEVADYALDWAPTHVRGEIPAWSPVSPMADQQQPI
jgi:hypothetical protein